MADRRQCLHTEASRRGPPPWCAGWAAGRSRESCCCVLPADTLNCAPPTTVNTQANSTSARRAAALRDRMNRGGGASSTAVTRSRTRGALLAGLRSGNLASAVETMEAETAASSTAAARAAAAALGARRPPMDEDSAARCMQRTFRGFQTRKQLLAELDAELLALEEDAAEAEEAEAEAAGAADLLSATLKIQAWRRGVNGRRAWQKEIEDEAAALEEEEAAALEEQAAAEDADPRVAVEMLRLENEQLKATLTVMQAAHAREARTERERRLREPEPEPERQPNVSRSPGLLRGPNSTDRIPRQKLAAEFSHPDCHEAACKIQRNFRARAFHRSGSHCDLQALMKMTVSKLAAKEMAHNLSLAQRIASARRDAAADYEDYLMPEEVKSHDFRIAK